MADLVTDDTLADVLLPGNSFLYEEAHLQAMIEAWPLDIDALERERDPMRCRIENLIFLFFQKGGTYWNDRWPEAKKRAYVRDLWIYKRLEGTPLGVELYANLEGALLLREELPPNRAAIVSQANLDRDQVLALMPQLRLYHRWPDRFVNKAVLAIGARAIGRSAVRRMPAALRGRYPVHFDPATGVETPLGISGVDLGASKVTLTFPGTRGHGFVIGRSAIGKGAFGPVDRPAPITVDLADPTLQTVSVPPPARRGLLIVGKRSGRAIGRNAVANVIPDEGTYDRLYLWDGSRIPPRAGMSGPAMAIGVSRLGLPPYHQVLHFAVPGWPNSWPQDWRRVGRMPVFARRADRPVALAMRAIECARRPGDRILVKLENWRPGARPAPLPTIGDLAE